MVEEQNHDTNDEDDGFEDCVYGGLRPNYRIPLLLSDMKEETLDEIILSTTDLLSCASCSFQFTDYSEMRAHSEKCDGKPTGSHVQEYQLSQYHTNCLILALKEMYEAGTGGSNAIKTDTRLPFYMEPFAGASAEHHNRVVGNLAIVTCRMCKGQYIHKTQKMKLDTKVSMAAMLDDNEEYNPSSIRDHVPACPEYKQAYSQFMKTMKPFIDKIVHHYNSLFEIYKSIRRGIYGSGFKIRTAPGPFTWREMGTIYEADETHRDTGQSINFRRFNFKLHTIEPEKVDFVQVGYFNKLSETLDHIFFTRVTGL